MYKCIPEGRLLGICFGREDNHKGQLDCHRGYPNHSSRREATNKGYRVYFLCGRLPGLYDWCAVPPLPTVHMLVFYAACTRLS
eukprot:12403551-Karenia_brevis.AAC.1